MSEKNPDNNPITVAFRELFAPLVKQSQRLPPPLAYSFAIVLVILVIILLGAVIPRDIVILIGVIVVLALGAFILADWDARRQSQIGPQPTPDSQTLPTVTLGVPTAGKLGLLVDLSHQQSKWKSGSIFDLPLKDNNLSALFMPPTDNLPWDIQAIQEVAQFIKSDLSNWRGLVFGMPYHCVISEEICNAIAEWVRQGGRLVLLGYELGERHHRNNLNELSDRLFGVRFNSDIVAPSGWQPVSAKPYGQEIVFDEIDSSRHSILKGVRKLCMRNICTLTTEPGSTTIVAVGKNRISKETNPSYTDGWTSSGTQQFELVPNGDWFPVIAEAPQDLCGKGRVIAIGTWDFFGVDDCFKNSDNYTFLRNLLTWSLER